MNRRIKVLHLLWSGGIGGTEEYIISLLNHFDYSKYEISLCFLSEKGVMFEEAKKTEKAHIYFIGIKGRFDIMGAIKLARILLRTKFEIIHSHSTNILSNFVIALFRKPIRVFTEHVSPGANVLMEKRKLFYRLFINSYHIIFAISGYVKQKLVEDIHIDPDKIEIVHNGIRIEKFAESFPPPADHNDKQSNVITIGFVGRMVNFKRPLLFIEIASELLKRDKKYRFIMVGDGPEMERCKKMINKFGINRYFKLLGYRRDIPRIYKLFSALLFTSRGEGFGIVIIESMAMGIPVFAVNDGSVPEIVRNGENGILLDSRDPEKMSEQIFEATNNSDLMGSIGKQCVEDVRLRFSIDRCARHMEDIYEKTILSLG
jgi:glycosyltransferase involved in cell wall biosynthesis